MTGMKFEYITPEELGKGSKIALEIVDTEDDIYYHMALHMLKEIKANNAAGKKTVFIVPVGPVGQYRRLARLVNEERINLKNVYFINMDEYLDDDGKPISKDHPLSFTAFMDREFYLRVDPELVMPEENRIIPSPDNVKDIPDIIGQLGGVDVAYGGIGINGHIAFNEPPEPGETISNEEFKNLPSRVLKLSRETRTINAVTAANGYIDYIPQWCVTVGMREILSAKKIRFYLNRTWQRGIVRKILHGEVTAKVPASFFKEHPDATLIIASSVAEMPLGQLR